MVENNPLDIDNIKVKQDDDNELQQSAILALAAFDTVTKLVELIRVDDKYLLLRLIYDCQIGW
jgi:hypothetical protein